MTTWDGFWHYFFVMPFILYLPWVIFYGLCNFVLTDKVNNGTWDCTYKYFEKSLEWCTLIFWILLNGCESELAAKVHVLHPPTDHLPLLPLPVFPDHSVHFSDPLALLLAQHGHGVLPDAVVCVLGRLLLHGLLREALRNLTRKTWQAWRSSRVDAHTQEIRLKQINEGTR